MTQGCKSRCQQGAPKACHGVRPAPGSLAPGGFGAGACSMPLASGLIAEQPGSLPAATPGD